MSAKVPLQSINVNVDPKSPTRRPIKAPIAKRPRHSEPTLPVSLNLIPDSPPSKRPRFADPTDPTPDSSSRERLNAFRYEYSFLFFNLPPIAIVLIDTIQFRQMMWIIAILQVTLLNRTLQVYLCRVMLRFSVCSPVTSLCIVGPWIHKPLPPSMVLTFPSAPEKPRSHFSSPGRDHFHAVYGGGTSFFSSLLASSSSFAVSDPRLFHFFNSTNSLCFKVTFTLSTRGMSIGPEVSSSSKYPRSRQQV